jgi:hypothetical protein
VKRFVLVSLAATSLVGLALSVGLQIALWFFERNHANRGFWQLQVLTCATAVPANLILIARYTRTSLKEMVLHMGQGWPPAARIALAALFTFAVANWAIMTYGVAHGNMLSSDDDPTFVRMLAAIDPLAFCFAFGVYYDALAGSNRTA